jgi:hypothetical protein
VSAPRSARTRTGRSRDRRGRGLRGPRALPGPLTPGGIPRAAPPSDTFDRWVASAAERLRRRGKQRGFDLQSIQFGVEETPLLPDDWDAEVPLSGHRPASGGHPAQVVVYRLPVAGRARGRMETVALVLDLLIEEVAELLDLDADDLDPRLP